MSAYECHTTHAELQDALENWYERWVLEGQYVACPRCHAQQRVDHAYEPFLHVDGCTLASDVATCPWMALRDLLADLSPVPA